MLFPGIHKESKLLYQLAAGDDQAFRTLLKMYWSIIYGLALRYLKSPELAEDAVQEVFLKVWEKRTELPSIERFDSFIFIITRNHVISELRKKIMKPLNGDIIDELQELTMIPDKMFDSMHTIRSIDKAIELLPLQRKEIFLLSRRDNLSYDEIAVRLKMTKSAVKGNIATALHFLREYLRAEEGIFLLIVFLHFFSS